jgi:hypothetical protein
MIIKINNQDNDLKKGGLIALRMKYGIAKTTVWIFLPYLSKKRRTYISKEMGALNLCYQLHRKKK